MVTAPDPTNPPADGCGCQYDAAGRRFRTRCICPPPTTPEQTLRGVAGLGGEIGDAVRDLLAERDGLLRKHAAYDAAGGATEDPIETSIEAAFGEIEELRRQRDDLETKLAAHKARLHRARTERDELREHILDIAAHATPYGDIPDDPGYVGTYLLTAGALHRALGKIGHTAPSCTAEAQRAAALALHPREVHQVRDTEYEHFTCGVCLDAYEDLIPWPCPTAQALGATDPFEGTP